MITLNTCCVPSKLEKPRFFTKMWFRQFIEDIRAYAADEEPRNLVHYDILKNFLKQYDRGIQHPTNPLEDEQYVKDLRQANDRFFLLTNEYVDEPVRAYFNLLEKHKNAKTFSIEELNEVFQQLIKYIRSL